MSHYNLNDRQSSNIKDFNILLNQYLTILATIFLIQAVSNFIFMGINNNGIGLLSLSLLSLSFIFFFTNMRRKKIYLSFIFWGLTLIITYYSTCSGLDSGVFLFYFPLLSAVPIFFSYKKDKLYVIVVLIFIILNMYLLAVPNFKLLADTNYSESYNHTLFSLNITCILLLLFLNFITLEMKREDYYFILSRNIYKKEKIENLSNEIARLKKLLKKDNTSNKQLEELMYSIKSNDIIFIEKFEVFFPDFFMRIESFSDTRLSTSDLKLCAMLKLALTTKQIAKYTNSTIKSVESKKYRLRKKLNISHEPRDWFVNF